MLTTEILNHVGFEKILIKYQKALQYLENWKIKIPKDSRLFNYEQSIKYLAAKGIGENPSHLCDLMFDLIEIDEISDIILNENNILSDNEIMGLLQVDDIKIGQKIIITALSADLVIAEAVKNMVQIGHAKKTNSLRFVLFPWL